MREVNAETCFRWSRVFTGFLCDRNNRSEISASVTVIMSVSYSPGKLGSGERGFSVSSSFFSPFE